MLLDDGIQPISEIALDRDAPFGELGYVIGDCCGVAVGEMEVGVGRGWVWVAGDRGRFSDLGAREGEVLHVRRRQVSASVKTKYA
jgi:hypothetical protein